MAGAYAGEPGKGAAEGVGVRWGLKREEGFRLRGERGGRQAPGRSPVVAKWPRREGS